MKILLLVLSAVAIAGCVALPRGSYLEGTSGYSKSNGVGFRGTIHIPLDGGYRK